MRLTTMSSAVLRSLDGHGMTLSGPHGEALRIDILEQDVVRLWFMPDGTPRLNRTWAVAGPGGAMPREGRRRDDLSPFTLPGFSHEMAGQAIHLHAGRLTLHIDLARLHIVWADATGTAFAADLWGRGFAHDRGGRAVRHTLARRADEHYYGFGEKAGPLDKAGLRLRMDAVDALAYNAENSDPLYKHWPFGITYVPDRGIAYGLFYDNPASAVFDLGREINAIYGPYRYYEAADGDIDCYLIYGPGIPEVVEKFTRLTGRPCLPPRWTLGYLGSTMRYTELPDADAQLRGFIARCAGHDIPCDGFHLSSGYTTDAAGKRQVFTWNRAKIPDPAAMTAAFHTAGMHVLANIKPHLLRSNPAYDEVVGRGGFVRAAEADAPEVVDYWSGGIAETDPASYIDFSSAAGFDWWRGQVRQALLECGVDAPWNDNNEFELRDDAARCAGFGELLPVGLARPILTLLMGLASYEAVREAHPDRRPFVVTRAASPGMQRYAQTWSGDNHTSWHTLRYNIPMGLGLSLSGMPNTGHDVGGFAGQPPEPELFLRWVQNGIFHPRFTIHSLGLGGQATEPWMYPEVLPLVREAIRFRYRLLPYLYTLLAEAARTGAPIVRPLVYHFAHDPHCRMESFDFMLGPNLLVASVLEPGARTRAVYLPAGTAWCDFHTGQWHAGGQMVTLDAPLERIPLLVPADGLIPLGRAMRHVGAEPDSLREVHVFPSPGGGEGAFALVEDDGWSMAYTRGEQTRLTLRVAATAAQIVLAVDPPQGGFPLPYDTVAFVLPPGEMRPVSGGEVATGEDGRRRVQVAVPPGR
ncbi:MAG: glycoside hydrolase family 31 protein [Anaerolineae bacterium]|nr:glycoside hydrolase family 31 protein [Anaerolineae bacterium]